MDWTTKLIIRVVITKPLIIIGQHNTIDNEGFLVSLWREHVESLWCSLFHIYLSQFLSAWLYLLTYFYPCISDRWRTYVYMHHMLWLQSNYYSMWYKCFWISGIVHCIAGLSSTSFITCMQRMFAVVILMSILIIGIFVHLKYTYISGLYLMCLFNCKYEAYCAQSTCRNFNPHSLEGGQQICCSVRRCEQCLFYFSV